MVGAIGFEPTTYGSQNRRATRLRYAPTGAFLQSNVPVEKPQLTAKPRYSPEFRQGALQGQTADA